MQKDMRDMDDESMKALANDILAKCQEQELSYGEMRILLTVLLVRLDEAKGRIERAALFQKAEMNVYSNNPQISTKGVYDRAVALAVEAIQTAAMARKFERSQRRHWPGAKEPHYGEGE